MFKNMSYIQKMAPDLTVEKHTHDSFFFLSKKFVITSPVFVLVSNFGSVHPCLFCAVQCTFSKTGFKSILPLKMPAL